MNTFLGCFKLESDGIAIGWTNIMMGTLTLVYSLFVIGSLHVNRVEYRDAVVPEYARVAFSAAIKNEVKSRKL